MAEARLSIFTWHIHGTYLFYLSCGNFDIYIPVNEERTEGYYGRGQTFPFGGNVIEIPAAEVRHRSFDCILFQTRRNYEKDQYEVLSEEQRKLPRIYLEHDPPWEHPTDAQHVVTDPGVTLVHVTHFNRLMWKTALQHVRVIEHGIPAHPPLYTGELPRGLVVVNHLHKRGRIAGADIFDEVSKQVPMDLVGMDSSGNGGLGEVLHPDLPMFSQRYRFLFNPMRYTSLGLAVLEAMMIGMPVVTLGVTEYSTVVRNGISGYVHTDPGYLVEKMKLLLEDHTHAAQLGAQARNDVAARFSLRRFLTDWEELFHQTITQNTIYEKESSIY